MKKFASLLAIIIALTSISFPVNAEDGDLGEGFADKVSECYMRCQPTSALRLDSENIVITQDDLSPNYDKGVVDLPRLSQDYYYAIDNLNSEFYLGLTVYPTLYWTPSAQGTTVDLCIYSHTSGDKLYSFSISVAPDVEGIAIADFHDCSSGLVNALVDAGENMRRYKGFIATYNPERHKDSIVMYDYAYTPDIDCFPCDADTKISYDTGQSFDNLCFVYSRRNISAAGIQVQNNIKEYVTGNNSAGAGVLFAGSKYDNCYYDNNNGVATTYTTLEDVNPLYSFIATSNRTCFYKVDTNVVNDIELSRPMEDNPNQITMMSTTTYTMSTSVTGFTNYEPWFRWATKYSITTMVERYGFIANALAQVDDVNVYSQSLMFAGVDAHFATATIKPYPKQAHISYFVPNAVSGNFELSQQDTVDVTNLDSYTIPDVPSRDNYTPLGWFMDRSLTTPFTKDKIKTDASSILSIYAAYEWSGGSYHVSFYNEMDNNFFLDKEFNCNQLPTLPEVKSDKMGYVFREWLIVDSKDATSGEKFDPNTFKPARDTTYILKAMWDNMGTVVDVTTTRPYRYIGEEITADSLKVKVTVPGTSETRELAPNEFTISPNIISKVGDNTFIITFTETGSQGICNITGVQENPMNIQVTYNGGDTYVGTQLTTGMFTVMLTYNSGRTEKIGNFVIDPQYVTAVGDNPVKITYLDFSTTINVKGIEPSKPQASLTKITATYVGGGLKVGDELKGSDMLVKAIYSDGTEISLTADQYQIAPNKFNTAGTQMITVVFGGLNATTNVTVAAVTQPQQPQTTPKPQQPLPQPTQKPTTSTTMKPSTGTSGNTTTNPQTNQNGGTNNSGSGSNSTSGGPITIAPDKSPSGVTGVTYPTQDEINGLVAEIKQALGVNGNNWEHTTSIGYIRGSNILTDVIYLNDATGLVNNVDILALLKEMTESQKQLTVSLINGASGNELSPEILSWLKEKEVSLYINMISPLEENVALGRWVITGSGLDNTDITIDPNITYEIIPKESDKLLYIAIGNVAYPKGVSVQAYPEIGTFGSNELVRQYTCTVTKDNAHMQRAFTWQDSPNAINLDPYTNLFYALSNSSKPYDEGTSLLTELNAVTKDDVESNTQVSNPTDSTATDSDGEDEDEWDWDTTVEEYPTNEGSNPPLWIFISAIVAAVCVIAGVVVTIILILKKKSTNTE